MTDKEIIEVEKARELLTKHGYFVGNLWSVEDVTQNYDCSDEDALSILDSVLTNDWITEQIFVAIDDECNADGIKPKD